MAYQRPIRQSPRDQLLVLRIVHVAMVASVLIYGGVVAMLTRPPAPGTVVPGAPVARTDVPEALTVALAAVAAVTAIGILLVRRRVRPGRYAAPVIVSWALAETIAVYGLLLGMVHRDLVHFLPFGAVSLIAILLLAPRGRHLDLLSPP